MGGWTGTGWEEEYNILCGKCYDTEVEQELRNGKCPIHGKETRYVLRRDSEILFIPSLQK